MASMLSPVFKQQVKVSVRVGAGPVTRLVSGGGVLGIDGQKRHNCGVRYKSAVVLRNQPH